MAGTQATILLFLFFFPAASVLSSTHQHDEDDYILVSLQKEMVTRLQFYVHVNFSGGLNVSVVEVAYPLGRPRTANGVDTFGSVYVVDELMTDGPELNKSRVLGNSQGIFAGTGMSSPSLVLGIDLQFTSGPFKGSSFVVYSRNPISEPKRELAVVGGRGKFRMARGFVLLRTYRYNVKTGDSILEYNVTLVHYDWNF